MRFDDLFAHKGHADASMLTAILQRREAAADGQLRVLLHHMLVANRFWLLTILGEPFDAASETRVPDSLEPLIESFRATHECERGWVAGVTEESLTRVLEGPLIPGGRCRVSDALLQVCFHSQGHRAQCAKMLRALGGHPPMTDFILWLVNRPAPAWPGDSSSSVSSESWGAG
jgi:uncharacterized damage-inducible protein DinB